MSVALTPLQVIDSFLLDKNVGMVLFLASVVTTLALVPLGSKRLLGLNITVFGLIFLLTPVAVMPPAYLFYGIGLVVVGPMTYVIARK